VPCPKIQQAAYCSNLHTRKKKKLIKRSHENLKYFESFVKLKISEPFSRVHP